jgi:hypothetical protein
MNPNDALPQATEDPEPVSAQPPYTPPAAPSPAAAHKLAPVRRQIIRAVPRQPELVQRQATVSYFRKLRKGRVCALTVKLDEASKNAPPATREGTITVEPVIPGALVYPSHAELSTQPGSEYRFSVLPLCSGKLRPARVEFRARGKSLQSMPVKMKVVRRRLAWLLLFFTIIVTGLMVWDRHISPFEPMFVEVRHEQPAASIPQNQPQQRRQGDPRGGGAAIASAEGLTPPPAVNASALTPPKELPLYGEAAIDGWIAHHARRSSSRWEYGGCEITDLAVLGLDAVHSWKFGGDWLEDDEKDKSVITWTYRGRSILYNLPMSEVCVGALLLSITALVWYVQGPARARRRSPAFEVSIP